MIEKQRKNVREKAEKAKLKRCTSLIAVLENPKTIENIGSAIRNVDALGVSKLYVVDGSNLLGGRNWKEMRESGRMNKISASAIKWIFVKSFPTTEACINRLKEKRFISMVTSPHVKGKKNVILEEGNYTQKRLAIWFGNESQGISEKAVENSEACINIPMCGIIESLNLGTSTGIVLYEAVKQRRKFKKK